MKNPPLYLLIKDYLNTIISENSGKSNFLLPSENRLVIKFSASRVSVRKALTELENEGLIYKVKGKGSYINSNIKVLNEQHKRSKRIVAFIYPDAYSRFSEAISHGMSTFLDMRDFDYLPLPSNKSFKREEKNISLAVELGAAGIMLMPVSRDIYGKEILGLKVHNVPCILVDKKLPGLDLPCVSSDHYEMGYSAVQHLTKLNRRDIAIVFVAKNATSVSERLKGYKDALIKEAQNSRTYIADISDVPESEYVDFFTRFMRNSSDVDGVICTSGKRASYFIKAMSQCSKRLHYDYDMVLFDEESENFNITLNKPLAAIIQNGREIGRIAATQLCDFLEKGTPMKDTKVPLKVKP